MKKNVLIAVALFATMAVNAQSIAAVSPSNVTTMYQTLDDAVANAENGSIIYLPGGGFQIKDETKIKKKFTIMGVSHRADADNADGATVISGNLNFDKGSDGSSVVGVYISGNIYVGTAADSVRNLTVRFCNVNSIQVKHYQSSGLFINQCYLRGWCNFGRCNVRFENNVSQRVELIVGGIINHNIMYYGEGYAIFNVHNSIITNNILIGTGGWQSNISQNMTSNNGASVNIGENGLGFGEGDSWDNIFEKNKGYSINSIYKLKGTRRKNAGTDGTDLGIYGGSGFYEKKSLAPIPRIVSKKVDEHTDGSGNLHIEIAVKAE